MLLTIQFPIIDLRYFLHNTGQLQTPSWAYPVPEFDFVRNFGTIRYRKLGGIEGWIGENEICEARRIIRFKSGIRIELGGNKKKTNLRCAFKRLYFDGTATGKFEIGISLNYKKEILFKKIRAEDLLSFVLSLPVTISVNKKKKEYKLLNAGDGLASSYLLATTKHGFKKIQPWWVISGVPLLFLEHGHDNIVFSTFKRKVLEQDGFQLFWSLVPFQGRQYRMWVLRAGPGNTSLHLAYDQARSLRIALLRLNAEHDSLRAVLRNIDQGKITDLGEDLQRFLNDSTRKILHLETSIEKDANNEVIRRARRAFDSITPGERERIMPALDRVRLNIKRKIGSYADKDARSRKITLNINFNNLYLANQGDIDLEKLAKELELLQKHLEKKTEKPEEEADAKAIAEAKAQAKKGNGAKALEILSKVGLWILDVAVKIGAPVAATAIKVALGLP